MIVVDTTALVYAVGASHPLREPCRTLVAAIEAGDVRATTTPEVVQEFTHVRARRTSRRDAVSLAESYAALLAPLAVVDADDLTAGLELFRRHDALGAFDAVLAATALRRGADGLVSADEVFARVRGLTHLDPARSDFVTRLARHA